MITSLDGAVARRKKGVVMLEVRGQVSSSGDEIGCRLLDGQKAELFIKTPGANMAMGEFELEFELEGSEIGKTLQIVVAKAKKLRLEVEVS